MCVRNGEMYAYFGADVNGKIQQMLVLFMIFVQSMTWLTSKFRFLARRFFASAEQNGWAFGYQVCVFTCHRLSHVHDDFYDNRNVEIDITIQATIFAWLTSEQNTRTHYDTLWCLRRARASVFIMLFRYIWKPTQHNLNLWPQPW